MVTVSDLSKCPIRNVLSRICRPDTLWVLHLLEAHGEATLHDFGKWMEGVSYEDMENAVRSLAEDRIIGLDTRGKYSLTDTGRSFLPPMRALEKWCEKQIEEWKAGRR